MRYIFLLLWLFVSYPAQANDDYANSIFVNGSFHNIYAHDATTRPFNMLRFFLFDPKGYWPDWIENTYTPNLQKNSAETVLTFIGHASYLLEVGHKKILFDPMLSSTAGPMPWLGVKRHRNPAIEKEQLPKIDYILISHNHYDHLDLPTLTFLVNRDHPKIFVPKGNKAWMEAAGISNIAEMDWWQHAHLDANTDIHFVPAQHFSGRGLFDRNASLWGGFVVKTPQITVLHAGDTGYSTHFKAIKKRFDIDVALLPIGDYKPDTFLFYHMNPEQAVQAYIDLQATYGFSMHADTFPLSNLGFLDAHKALRSIVQSTPEAQRFFIMEVGESRRF